eukprot:5371900-Ditylum_brightwellii.AAC.1
MYYEKKIEPDVSIGITIEDRESDVDVSSGNSNNIEGNDDELNPKENVMFTDEDEEIPELMERTWEDDDS